MNTGSVFLVLLGVTRCLSFPTGCQVDEWQCLDGTCIALDAKCDSVPDCNDGSDEQNCAGSPICLEGLESCPQPDGSTICVVKAVGCGCGLVPDIPHAIIVNYNTTIGSSANVTCDDGYVSSTPFITCENTGIWQTAVCIPKDCGRVKTIQFGTIYLSDISNTTFGASGSVVCDTGYETLTPIVICQASGKWDTAECTIIDCGSPPNIAFGNITLDKDQNSTYGAKALVTCADNYEASRHTVSCKASGLWEQASCTLSGCGAVPAIYHGSISTPGTSSIGSFAIVSCDVGYEASTSTVKCDGTGKWENVKCSARDCGPLQMVAFGKLSLNDVNNTTYGATASITCDTGYATNVPTVSCQSSGVWETASCKPKDCGPVHAITFGTLYLNDNNNTTYGATANLTCDTGYEASVATVSCSSLGFWESASCKPRDCGPVQDVAFGKITLHDVNNTTYGATASLTCHTGYEASLLTVSCQSSGVWDTALCKAKDCGPLPNISFGKINLKNVNNTTYGASAFITCDTGYRTNVSTVACQRSGLWETAICEATDCGPVPVISFGKINLLDIYNTSYGASAVVTCDTGFESNVLKVICQRTGKWETATCKRKDCGTVPTISYGKIDLIDINNTSYGASATATCDTGFETSVSKITCQSSGLWETTLCSAKDCGPVPEVPFGKIYPIDVKNTTYGASAYVTCDQGFDTNLPKITCQSLGVWQTAFCKPKDCGPVPLIASGMASLTDVNNTTYGATADVTCNTGFETSMTTLTCQSSGSWQTTLCTAKGCSSSPTIPNGRMMVTGNSSVGSFANVICNSGYEANIPSVKCQDSGSWEAAECHIKACGPVPTIKHGRINLIDTFHKSFGDSADVICDTGYETSTIKVTCQSSGAWETALCTPKDCGTPPVISNGNITLSGNNMTTYGAKALVNCHERYVASMPGIKCQSSGSWEVAKCVSESQLNYDKCTEEHGVCTQHIYENVRVLALKSSKCKTFCHCAHAATLSDGSVTYKWVEHSCPLGTLFDDSLPSPVCNHHYMVWC